VGLLGLTTKEASVVTAQEATALVQELHAELSSRRKDIRIHDAAYRGDRKLHFASEQFSRFMGQRYEGFSDNWCGVVGDAPIERLEVMGIRPNRGVDEDAAAAGRDDSDLWRVWLENEADFHSDLSFLDATVTSRSFALVWGNPDDEQTPRITWEHPSQAVVIYDPETGRRRAGLKVWADGNREFATLYLPDEVWKFSRRRNVMTVGKSALWTPSSVGLPGGWEPRQPETDIAWPIRNPMGVVPLVELQNRPRTLGGPMSDVAGTLAMQDAINLLWAYLLNAADFASLPQRVVLGADLPKVPVLNDQGDVIGSRDVPLEKFGADRVVWLTSKDAEIDQWDAAALDVYTKVIEVQVAHIAAQTRTPQHYLIGKMANLSADALKAAETGLVKRTEEKTEHYGRAVREIFRLIALARGEAGRAKMVAGGEVLWKDVESRSRQQTADELVKMRSIGFPFEFLAEKYGLSPTEIDRVVALRSAELRDASMADIEALFGAEGATDRDREEVGAGAGA
jgi:hypothetical protein